MIKLKHTFLYLFFQFLGWGTYVAIAGYSIIQKQVFSNSLLLFLVALLLVNIGFSHLFKIVIKKYNWIVNHTLILVTKVFLSCLVLALLFSLSTNLFSFLFTANYDGWIDFNSFFTGFMLYFIWSTLYFVSKYFVRSRTEEMKNLKLESLKNEIELQNLRAQLNPHFMFNAMNSIRALIDENPKLAKKAITQLSNILRNALVHNQDQLISLKDELALVDDYLSLEKIRFEERLTIIKNIANESLTQKIPPLLLQTIVENAIKHGIAKLIKGGVVKIETEISNNELIIKVVNTGVFTDNEFSETGVGVVNTKKRLSLAYGSSASFSIKNTPNKEVETTVVIPIIN